MIPSGTSSLRSAPASVTPVCPPGTASSPSRICGKLLRFSPIWINSRLGFSNTGRIPSTLLQQLAERGKTTDSRKVSILPTTDEQGHGHSCSDYRRTQRLVLSFGTRKHRFVIDPLLARKPRASLFTPSATAESKTYMLEF